MPNLLVYPIRGVIRKLSVSFLKFQEKPDVLVVSPGGCGSITLIKYLDKYKKSNIYFEKKYKFFHLGHIYKPNSYLKKNKIKIILINRDHEDIFNSMLTRGFLRNSLNIFGDCFPFMYKNIFKDKKKLKNKYLKNLKFFYSNWKIYDNNLILRLNFSDIYKDVDCQRKIMNFLNIKTEKFLKEFPKYERYNKGVGFVDPSTNLTKELYNDNNR